MTLRDPAEIFRALGLRSEPEGAPASTVEKISPATGAPLGRAALAARADVEACTQRAVAAFEALRAMPGPKRGDIARALADAFRAHKHALGALISLETGKIRAEGEGEVQEIIDIADYAVGLSRTIGGRTLMSERANHRLTEQWHPLGPVAVITAFNFPAAVWAWNALLALVCGDSVVWKPSLKAPFTALAVQRICAEVLARFARDLGEPRVEHALQTCIGTDDVVGAALTGDARYPLVSATGSTRMGRAVQSAVHARFGRTLLELGGNNAVIVLPDADLALAVRAIVFGAVGTTGQRCTSTRRVLVHESIAPALMERLVAAYRTLNIGHPLDDGVHVGPLVDLDAVALMRRALDQVRAQGGQVVFGGLERGGCYVEPALCESTAEMPIVREETFAPVLHVIRVRSLEHAIDVNNAVAHGLSSSLFTRDLLAAERFLSARGSDCGIANINTGTSGAEIGGAFGGEKETGGGREAGSDSWKAYMRRQTCTINYGTELPLAQGIKFDA
jgi:aldehyde dehydrogenase (NAD+)